jgi:hypothetical protein
VIATRAPELRWSPGTKQRIASWVERLGWMPPPAGSAGTAVQLSASETAMGISKAPVVPSPDLMEYRGVRYTIRIGITRGQWQVAIYFPDTELPKEKSVIGTRQDAEITAHSNH